MLAERSLYQFVVVAAKRLGHLGNSVELLVTHAFEQGIYRDGVPLYRWRDPQADGVELHARGGRKTRGCLS